MKHFYFSGAFITFPKLQCLIIQHMAVDCQRH